MKFAYYKGYELGGKAVEFLVGPTGVALRKAIGTVGGMVIGAVAATWVSVKTSFELKNAGGKPFLQLQKKVRCCLSWHVSGCIYHSLLVVNG